MKSTFIKLTFAFITCCLGAIWFLSSSYSPFFNNQVDRFGQCRSNKVVGKGSIGGPFKLMDTNGQLVTEKDIIDAPSLIYFGYTFCPDICPMDAVRNSEAVDLLYEKGKRAIPVFISIDPLRDTPEKVADFVEMIHPNMVGLTGTIEQIRKTSKTFKTYFKAHNSQEKEFYLVDHSTMTYLVLPEHGFVEFFRRDMSAQKVAEITACFIENS